MIPNGAVFDDVVVDDDNRDLFVNSWEKKKKPEGSNSKESSSPEDKIAAKES